MAESKNTGNQSRAASRLISESAWCSATLASSATFRAVNASSKACAFAAWDIQRCKICEFRCLGILMFVVILRYTDICYVDSDHEHEKLQALTQLHHFVTSLGLLHSLLSLFGLRRLIFHFCVRSCNGLTSKGMAKM